MSFFLHSPILACKTTGPLTQNLNLVSIWKSSALILLPTLLNIFCYFDILILCILLQCADTLNTKKLMNITPTYTISVWLLDIHIGRISISGYGTTIYHTFCIMYGSCYGACRSLKYPSSEINIVQVIF